MGEGLLRNEPWCNLRVRSVPSKSFHSSRLVTHGKIFDEKPRFTEVFATAVSAGIISPKKSDLKWGFLKPPKTASWKTAIFSGFEKPHLRSDFFGISGTRWVRGSSRSRFFSGFKKPHLRADYSGCGKPLVTAVFDNRLLPRFYPVLEPPLRCPPWHLDFSQSPSVLPFVGLRGRLRSLHSL